MMSNRITRSIIACLGGVERLDRVVLLLVLLVTLLVLILGFLFHYPPLPQPFRCEFSPQAQSTIRVRSAVIDLCQGSRCSTYSCVGSVCTSSEAAE